VSVCQASLITIQHIVIAYCVFVYTHTHTHCSFSHTLHIYINTHTHTHTHARTHAHTHCSFSHTLNKFRAKPRNQYYAGHPFVAKAGMSDCMFCREEHTALRRLVQDLRIKLEDAEARCRSANKGEDEVKERFKALQSKHDGIASEVCSWSQCICSNQTYANDLCFSRHMSSKQ
jgi:hypothetical protein